MNQFRILTQSAYWAVVVVSLLLAVGPIVAQNTAMEVDGDQTMNKTATINENLIWTKPAPMTPFPDLTLLSCISLKCRS